MSSTEERGSGGEAAVAAAPAVSASVDSIAGTDDFDADPAATAHLSDFECALCCCLLLDPVTTDGCGHTFCRQCLLSSLAVKKFCPLCRHPCSELDALTHPTAQLLATLAQRYFPAEYASRKASALAEGQLFQRRTASSQRLGIFLSTQPHFPHAPLQLHIYEPRYRVMISRAMATHTRTFIVMCVEQQRDPRTPAQPQTQAQDAAAPAVADGEERKEAPPAPAAVPAGELAGRAGIGSGGFQAAAPLVPSPFDPLRAGGGPHELPALLRGADVRSGDVACVVRISNVRAMPDGRSFVECRGVQRVRLAAVQTEDEQAFGLLSAEVMSIDDAEDEQHDAAQQQQQHLQAEEEEADELQLNDDGLRQRRAAGQAAASPRAAAAVTAMAPPHLGAAPPAAVGPSLLSSLTECRQLLQTYCSLNGLSEERLAAMHGGAACPLNERPSEFTFWLLSVLPENNDIKMEALASTSLRNRLQLCRELLHASIAQSQRRTQTQSRVIAVIAALALVMFIARHFNLV